MTWRERVLVAEDNAINQKVARALIEQLGFEVHIATNGAEAVRMVEGGEYVAVFMDIHMPDVDGYQATRIIRERLHSSVPIIGLSASVLPEDLEQCLTAGMNAHLAKPIDRIALRDTLDRVVALLA